MNYPKILRLSKANLATIFLVVFYLSEGLSKFSIIYLNGKSDLPRTIKFLVLLFCISNIIKPFRNLVFPSLLLVPFFIGQYFLDMGFNLEIWVSFSKFLFPIVLFIYFNKHVQNQTSHRLLLQTFEWLIIFNGILIFIGFLTKLEFFQTYNNSRFGFNGLLITSATSSYVYSLTLFYFLAKLKHEFFKSWKTWFIIVCCLMVGTKSLVIALFGVLLIFLFYFSNYKAIHRKILSASLIVVFIGILYFLFFHYGRFNEIRLQEGLFSSIFSYRDDLLLGETLPYIQNNWKWPNYLFGGISDLASRSQLGFIDIFYFWGIIGGLFYLYVFTKVYITFPLQNWQLYIFIILALIVFLSGNFFENASVAIYLLILKEKLINGTSFTHKIAINE